MGLILDKVGRIQEADAYLRQAFDIRTRLLPKGNLVIVKAEGALGECLTMQKRYAEAEPLLLGSYQVFESTTAPNDSRRSEAAQRLNDVYSRWGNPKKAALYKGMHKQVAVTESDPTWQKLQVAALLSRQKSYCTLTAEWFMAMPYRQG
jgi:hypothetical protein